MNAHRLNLFFYGLFMDEVLLRAQGFSAVNPRLARVTGMALRIGARATLVADAGATTHVCFMGATHAVIDRLYSEPSVAMYLPEAVLAECVDGSRVAALCFNLSTPP